MAFEQGGLKVIATQSPIVYRDLVLGFQGCNQLVNCYSDSYEKLELSHVFELEGDLLLTQHLSAKYLSVITKNYLKNIDSESRDAILKAYLQLENRLQDSLLLEDLPLEINFEEDLSKLVKLVGLHLDEKLMKNPYDILEMIIKVHCKCNLKTIPVICNAVHYLDQESFREIESLLAQLKETLFLIEFTDQQFQAVVGNAEFYYIDEDLVDWY
jgi:CRISPR type II-A-associated protein Csn2